MGAHSSWLLSFWDWMQRWNYIFIYQSRIHLYIFIFGIKKTLTLRTVLYTYYHRFTSAHRLWKICFTYKKPDKKYTWGNCHMRICNICFISICTDAGLLRKKNFLKVCAINVKVKNQKQKLKGWKFYIREYSTQLQHRKKDDVFSIRYVRQTRIF